jgi:uncharacterized membrane protein YkgB
VRQCFFKEPFWNREICCKENQTYQMDLPVGVALVVVPLDVAVGVDMGSAGLAAGCSFWDGSVMTK